MNKFELVNRVRQRAMQLERGDIPRIMTASESKPVTIALAEVKKGLVEFDRPSEPDPKR